MIYGVALGEANQDNVVIMFVFLVFLGRTTTPSVIQNSGKSIQWSLYQFTIGAY